MFDDANIMDARGKDNGGHFHAVRFYDDEVSLCRIVAVFLREGLAIGQPALVIATRSHAQGIVAELRAKELDVVALAASNDLVIVDAAEILLSFMVDGQPDAERFFKTANAALDRVRRGRRRITIRAYGEMVDVLWKEGRDLAAIRLEVLWNRLARATECSLMCGYATESFIENVGVKDVCRQHTHLVDADGMARVSNVDTLLVD
jgi:hypothetical protein